MKTTCVLISIDSWYVRKLCKEWPDLAKYLLADVVYCKGRRMYWRQMWL